MKVEHVQGQNAGKIMLYELSTCPWCKLTKRFLADLGVAFDYVDVDLISPEEKEKVMEEVEKWNPSCSFPTMVVNDKKCIVGYKQDEIKKALRM